MSYKPPTCFFQLRWGGFCFLPSFLLNTQHQSDSSSLQCKTLILCFNSDFLLSLTEQAAGVYHRESRKGRYQLTFIEAKAVCDYEGGKLATYEQLEAARQIGQQQSPWSRRLYINLRVDVVSLDLHTIMSLCTRLLLSGFPSIKRVQLQVWGQGWAVKHPIAAKKLLPHRKRKG